MNDMNSLTHTTWNCKYHIVFAPKYRRKVFYEGEEAGGRRNPENAVQLEEDKNSRGRGMPGSCAYARRNTAEGSSIEFHGISQGEKQPDDLRKVSGAEIQVPEP